MTTPDRRKFLDDVAKAREELIDIITKAEASNPPPGSPMRQALDLAWSLNEQGAALLGMERAVAALPPPGALGSSVRIIIPGADVDVDDTLSEKIREIVRDELRAIMRPSGLDDGRDDD